MTHTAGAATTAGLSTPIRYCARCNETFDKFESIAYTGSDEFWHLGCLVCAHCFRPFNDRYEYYEFAGKKYCERDFRTLFAPCCSQCDQHIVGRFIRALNKCWHPNCFLCERCQVPLADQGFMRLNGRALCYACNANERTNQNKHICGKCKHHIEEHEGPLRFKGEPYHAYHFNCQSCGVELRPDARQVGEDLFCLKCHDKMGVPICGGCRKPIEERVVTALGKHWHNEHFACASCERPFLGKRHFEVKGQAYCEQHYVQLFGRHCHVCSETIDGDVVSALGKYYCTRHFNCHFCARQLHALTTRFYDVSSNPCCKKCYKKFPYSFRKKLAKQHAADTKG